MEAEPLLLQDFPYGIADPVPGAGRRGRPGFRRDTSDSSSSHLETPRLEMGEAS